MYYQSIIIFTDFVPLMLMICLRAPHHSPSLSDQFALTSFRIFLASVWGEEERAAWSSALRHAAKSAALPGDKKVKVRVASATGGKRERLK